MGWWDDVKEAVSNAFSGGSDSSSSSSSSGGYEEAAYGGSKNDYYNSVNDSSNNDDDSPPQQTYNPNVGAPTVDSPSTVDYYDDVELNIPSTPVAAPTVGSDPIEDALEDIGVQNTLPTIDLDQSYLLDKDGNFVLNGDGTSYVTTPNQPTLRDQLGDTSDIFEYRENTAEDVEAIKASIKFNEELTSLQDKNESLQSEYDYYKEAYGESSIFAEELKKQLDENASLLSQYEADLNASTEEYGTLSDKFTDLTTDYDALQEQYTKYVDTSSPQGLLEASYGEAAKDYLGMFGDSSDGVDYVDYADTITALNDLDKAGGNTEDSSQVKDYGTLLDQYGDKATYAVFDDKVFVANPKDEAATYWNNIGKFIAGKIGGVLAGGILGDMVFALGGKDLGAVQGALYADAAGGGLTEFGAKRLFENSNIYKSADGTLYINDTLTNPFTGESTTNLMTVEEKTQQTIEFNERQAAAQQDDDYDTALVGEVVSGSTGDKINWRDARGNRLSMSPGQIINAAIGGVALPEEVVDAAKFTAQIADGVDPVQAATNVFTNNLTDKLPEGYDKATEAAVRVGIGGENKVAVFGDIYGKQFNLDNPLGKAGLEGAEEYDKTGDSDRALAKATYTYFKEGGKLPDVTKIFEGSTIPFKKPDLGFIEDTIKDFIGEFDSIDTPEAVKSIEDFARSAGSSFEDIVRAGGSAAEDFVRELLPKINLDVENPFPLFEGMSLEDVGLTLGDLPEGISLPDLGKLGFDLPSFDLDFDFTSSSTRGTGITFSDDDEEYESLAYEFSDDPTSSLARDLLEIARRQTS